VFYQGEVYSHALGVPPGINVPATLDKDAEELTYVGEITSITKKYAAPAKELQGNYWDMWHGAVYLHEDGYLYLFPVLGDACTLKLAANSP